MNCLPFISVENAAIRSVLRIQPQSKAIQLPPGPQQCQSSLAHQIKNIYSWAHYHHFNSTLSASEQSTRLVAETQLTKVWAWFAWQLELRLNSIQEACISLDPTVKRRPDNMLEELRVQEPLWKEAIQTAAKMHEVAPQWHLAIDDALCRVPGVLSFATKSAVAW